MDVEDLVKSYFSLGFSNKEFFVFWRISTEL